MTTLLRKAAPLAVVAAAAGFIALHHARPFDLGAFGRSAIGSGVGAPPNVGAATGVLPVANGGTGAATLAGANIAVTTGATFTGSITFSGSSPDVTAVSGENLEIVAAGAGNLILTGGPSAGDVRVSTGNAFTVTTNSVLRWTVSTGGVTTTTTPVVFSGVATDLQTSGVEDLTLAPGGRVLVSEGPSATAMFQITGQSGQSGDYLDIQAEDDTAPRFTVAPNGTAGSMSLTYRPLLTGAVGRLLQIGNSGNLLFEETSSGQMQFDTTSVVFANITNDVSTGTNEDFTIAPNGSGAINLNGDNVYFFDAGGTSRGYSACTSTACRFESSGSNSGAFKWNAAGASIAGTRNDVTTTGKVFGASDNVADASDTGLWSVYGDGLVGESTAANATCSTGTATVTVVSPTMTVNPNGAACTLTMATTNVTTIAKDVDVDVVVNGSVGAGVVTFASTNFTHLPASCTTTGVVNGDAVHFRWSATLAKWVYLGGCA